MLDRHKHDYLHAEGPNNGQWEGWKYNKNCTCDACTFAFLAMHQDDKSFKEDYEELQKIKEAYGCDFDTALNILMK